MSGKMLVRRYPITAYFIITYIISWSGALLLLAPKLLKGQPVEKMDGLLIFPVMLIGPALTGIILTRTIDKKEGAGTLWRGIGKWKLPLVWYAVIFSFPPVLILLVLSALNCWVSPAFKPNFFAIGVLFGIPAGFLEEIGWTGFAMQRLLAKYNVFVSGITLGLCWGLWHLPVIDFLGAAFPHSRYLLFFFLSFILLMTAIRILMTWIYARTQSIFLIQLLHVISTGSLIVLGPFSVSPSQEALWYFSYAVLAWIAVSLILVFSKRNDKPG